MFKSNVRTWVLLFADLQLHFPNNKTNSHDAPTNVTVDDAGNCSLAMIKWVVNDNKIISGLVTSWLLRIVNEPLVRRERLNSRFLKCANPRGVRANKGNSATLALTCLHSA